MVNVTSILYIQQPSIRFIDFNSQIPCFKTEIKTTETTETTNNNLKQYYANQF